MASSSWMASATNATAGLISAAAHELLIDPLHELSGAMEDALDMVVGAETQQSTRSAAKAGSTAEQRSALQDVSNTATRQTGAATTTPRTPLCKPSSRGGRAAPDSMTFAELMALITRRAQQVDELTAKLEHANRARLDAEARHAGEAARSGQLAEQLALLNHRNSIGDRAMMLGTKAKVDAA